MQKQNIAIFASGGGSNAEAIIRHFADSGQANVTLIICNKPGAGVIRVAEQNKIPVLLVNKSLLHQPNFTLTALQKAKVDLIVLAGFLLLVPEYLVNAYPSRILNIHPALLPDFGGKGMYGHHIHEAVLASGKKETGLTIHIVNNEYDKGAQIFQIKCPVLPTDTAEHIGIRVLALEHKWLPRVIGTYLEEMVQKATV